MIIALNGTVSCGKSYLGAALSEVMSAEFRGEPPMAEWPNAARVPRLHRDVQDMFLRSWRVSNLNEAKVLSKLRRMVVLDSVYDILHHTIVTRIAPRFFGSGAYASLLTECARIDHEHLPIPDVIVNVTVTSGTWRQMCKARGLDDFYAEDHLSELFGLQDVFHTAARLRCAEMDIPVLTYENTMSGPSCLSELAEKIRALEPTGSERPSSSR
ncbi:hypothetical protein KUV51_18820 [Tateyamaria omphalii]|uniref:hypothetical protein n=1 Tax=Tateyamaria omphalii TaxID=299262 RepID=UPI001C994E42|nr:hypothetical protein [Tateyamaria omphalii]MBY5935065.1 hypothetical protein [Tateyamaria omphalii]